ncbi:hypothetical protein U1708_00615 [Sphingomonas sp. ZB1N12]|uniref:hypothetical protein n=1 Tax=Sphingomonas arabinosi TaxID=3096160 RepID=UPI002FCBF782
MADARDEVKLYAFDTRQDASFNPLFTTISAFYRRINASGIAGQAVRIDDMIAVKADLTARSAAIGATIGSLVAIVPAALMGEAARLKLRSGRCASRSPSCS